MSTDARPGPRRAPYVAAGLLGLAAQIGCGTPVGAGSTEAAATDTSITPAAPLELGVVGCIALTPAQACTLSTTRALTLRIDGDVEVSAVQVRIDDVITPVEAKGDADGVTLRLEVPAGAARLRVDDGRGGSSSLVLHEDSEAYDAAHRALVARMGEAMPWPQLQREAETIAAALDSDADRHRFACAMAAAAFDSQQWQAVLAATAVLPTDAADLDIRCVAQAHVQAAHVAIYYAPDYRLALQHIAAAGAHPQDVEAQLSVDFLSGALEHRLGHYDAASSAFERATLRATRMHLPHFVAAIAVTHATTLAELGQFARADALADAAVAALPPGDATAADVRSNAAWVQLLHREVDSTAPDPTPNLQVLLTEYTARGDAVRAAAIRLDSAIAAAQSQRMDVAATELAQLDRTQVVGADQVWIEWVAAQVDGARHKTTSAREHLSRAQALAELHTQETLLMRVHAARGELEERVGNLAEARRAYGAAEVAEDRVALSIAPMAGRSVFTTTRWRDRARNLELALDAGDREAALCIVLAARSRHLRGLQARAVHRAPGDREAELRRSQLLLEYHERVDALSARAADTWRLSTTELARHHEREAVELGRVDELLREALALTETAPPKWQCGANRRLDPTHALLTMHPASKPGRWWLLVDRGGEIAVHGFEMPSDGPTTGLDPIDALGSIDGVHELTIVPLGELGATDLQGVPRPGVRVQYSLGLGTAGDAAIGADAVVVGEATNLREVADEAAAVAEHLRAVSMTVTTAWQPTTGGPSPGLLHYAGHATRGDATGWDSWIELDGRHVTAAEIVASGRSPAVVVLSACDAGASDPTLGDGGMNIASAFVLAGARLVIAPTRAVDDDLARAFSESLYASLEAGADQLPERMGAALAEVRARDARFAMWRAWVP